MSAVIEFLDRHMIAVSMVLGIILAVVVRKRTHPENKATTNSYDHTDEVCMLLLSSPRRMHLLP